MEGYFCMQISLFEKSYKYAGRQIKSILRPVISSDKKSYQIGDFLDISSLKKVKNPEEYECKGFTETVRQVKRYMKAFGVNFWDIVYGNRIHCADVIPAGIFDNPIHSVKRIASVKVKTRDKKVITADIDKIDLGRWENGDKSCQELFYVLKNKCKQLGYIHVMLKSDKDVYIEFLTNILGRKKCRNTEKILVQAVVEDCLRHGFVPRLDATAENVGMFMGRGYNNLSLYKRMGMNSFNPDYEKDVEINPEKVLTLLEKYIKLNGEIFKGSLERLKQMQH